MLKLNFKFKYHVPLILLASAVLAGCAAQRLHNNGMSLVQGGQVEEGLSQLEQATKADPENLNYQKDLKHTREQILNRLLSSASTEQSLGHAEAAQHIYERILKIDPLNSSATLALETQAMNKRHEAKVEEARLFFEKGDLDSARSALKPVFLENPKQGQAVLLQRQIDEQETKTQMAEPALNMQFKKPVTLQFRDANVKMVFEAISRASGINVLLDKDIKPDLKTSIFVKDVSVEDAIDLILMQSQLERKVLSNNTVFIYPNTAAKLKDFQDLKIRSFHLVNADPKQILTMLKTLLKTKDIFIHEKTNSIVMRDTPDAIHLAEKMIADQDIADPEVMLEVEILEVNRAHTSDLGIQYPNQLTLTPLIASLPATTSASTTGAPLTTTSSQTGSLTLSGTQASPTTPGNTGLTNLNKSLIAISPIPTLTLNAMMQDSDTNILSSPRLRVRNHEKAKIMIGDRVPIITNSLTPTTTGPGVVTGTVTYQDVGLKLDVEPEIHLDNEVSIKIALEVSSLGNAVTNSSTGSVVYTVQTRNTATSLRLRDGETQILAGLVQDSDTSTVDKVPVLGQIPLLGYLFSNDNGNKSKKEIILSITPHVVGHSKLADAREMEYWSGTESELRSSQLVLKPLGTVNMGTSAPGSSATPMPAGRPVTPPPAAQPVPAAKAPAAPALPPAVPAALPATPQADNAAKPVLAPPVISTPAVPPIVDPAAAATKDKTVSSAPAMTLSWQGPKQAKVGDKISVLLNTPSTQGAKTLGFQIGFDPAVLKPVDVIEGDALKRNNAAANLNKNIDQAGGSISIEMTGTGSSGSASVIALTFEVISSVPESSITLDSTTATGTNGEVLSLTAPDPYVITVTQ
jgi:general secretion pathway protein D